MAPKTDNEQKKGGVRGRRTDDIAHERERRLGGMVHQQMMQRLPPSMDTEPRDEESSKELTGFPQKGESTAGDQGEKPNSEPGAEAEEKGAHADIAVVGQEDEAIAEEVVEKETSEAEEKDPQQRVASQEETPLDGENHGDEDGEQEIADALLENIAGEDGTEGELEGDGSFGGAENDGSEDDFGANDGPADGTPEQNLEDGSLEGEAEFDGSEDAGTVFDPVSGASQDAFSGGDGESPALTNAEGSLDGPDNEFDGSADSQEDGASVDFDGMQEFKSQEDGSDRDGEQEVYSDDGSEDAEQEVDSSDIASAQSDSEENGSTDASSDMENAGADSGASAENKDDWDENPQHVADGEAQLDGANDDWAGFLDSSSEESDPFAGMNSGDFVFSGDSLNSIQSSFRSSDEDIAVLDQDNGGTSNIFEDQQGSLVNQEDWMEDETSSMSSSLFFALSIGVLAICFLRRRGPGHGQSRAGYRPVPSKGNQKKY